MSNLLNEKEFDKPIICPECGKFLKERTGKYGKFLGCTGYPQCKYTFDTRQKLKVSELPNTCPKCGKHLAIRKGKYGGFIGCTKYPKCNFTFNLSKEIFIPCPRCGKQLVARNGKYGAFLGCRGYPDCNFTYNISKNIKSKKTPKKSYRQKLKFDQIESPLSNDNIIKILSKEWHTIDQIANKLSLNDIYDIKFLRLKLKQKKRKNLISLKIEENQNYWRISENL